MFISSPSLPNQTTITHTETPFTASIPPQIIRSRNQIILAKLLTESLLGEIEDKRFQCAIQSADHLRHVTALVYAYM